MKEMLIDYYQSLCERIDRLREARDVSLQNMIELDLLEDVVAELGDILTK